LENDNKKKLLLVWGHHRKDWKEVFDRIREDFEYTYLFWVFPEDDPSSGQQEDRVIYWSQYRSAQAILKEVQPDKVVFLGLDAPNSIALLTACRNQKITTLFLQHGVTHSLDHFIFLIKQKSKQKLDQVAATSQPQDKRRLYLVLTSFFFRSMRLQNLLTIWDFIRLQYYKRSLVVHEALQEVAGKRRWANQYLVFSTYNAQLYIERDKVPMERLIEVGMPSMDTYFQHAPMYQTQIEEPYLLLIDQPLAENKSFNNKSLGISKEQMNSFYLKLNEYALKVKCKLYIKLHPFSYEDDFRVEHPNIVYLKDADNQRLIFESTAIFGMYSTMMVPALYFKKCCVFKIWEKGRLENCAEELEIAQILNFFTFTSDDINVINFEKNPQGLEKFVTRYFFKADDQAAGRIRSNLLV